MSGVKERRSARRRGAFWPWQRSMQVVLQAEAVECGLACVTMVARHHGHDVDLAGLRQRFPISMKGAQLVDLMAIANALDLAPRAVRAELKELKQLALPAILHWDFDHFVVLKSLSPGKAVILDPALGERVLSAAEVSRHFTGVALELTPTTSFKSVVAKGKTRITDLWSRLVGYRRAAVQIMLLSLIIQVTSLVSPFFMQLIVDEAISQGDSSLLAVVTWGFAAVFLIAAVTKALRSWVVLAIGQSLSYQLAGNIIRHLFRLPVDYFQRRHVGDLMSRIRSIQPVQHLLTEGVVSVFIDAALALTTLAVMFILSWGMTLLVLVSTVAYLAVSLAVFPVKRRRMAEEISARAREETFLLESLRAIHSLKLYGAEALREVGWRNRYAEVITASFRGGLYSIFLGFLENTILAMQMLILVYMGARGVMAGSLTVGMLFAFVAYRANFTSSATRLVEQAIEWRTVGLHLERLSDIVQQERESDSTIATTVSARPSLRADGAPEPLRITADRLTFRFSPTEKPLFEELSLDIPAGGFVAITGPSGSGKTTLSKLMLGLLVPESGQIQVNNVPLSSGSRRWRSQMGVVLQDDQLLTGSLADNISFFDPHPNQPLIEQCARVACVHDDIMAMPMDYRSLVGDMGAALSGGQRQRIMLARALYRQPGALILDEGTANLDEETEIRIAIAIARMPITRLVIAHRPALVRYAHTVYRLEKGVLELVRQGNAGEKAPAVTAAPVRRA
jgi:ATP-binding cassette subfamily B protein RaxB